MKALKNNQRGFSHLILPVVVAAVIVVVGVVVWSVASNNSVKVNKTVQTKCLAVLNDKTYCKFIAHIPYWGDYQLSVDITQNGSTSTVVASGQSNGNTQNVVTTGGVQQYSAVDYNGVVYTKVPGQSEWTQYSSNAASKPDVIGVKGLVNKNSDFKNSAGQKLTYHNLGKVPCGSLTCYKYQEVDPADSSAKSYILFDTKDYLLRSASVQGSSSGDVTITATYPTVTVAKPSPVSSTVVTN